MSPRAKPIPPPPGRRTAPVYRDEHIYYAPADAKRHQLTKDEQKQLQRRTEEEAARTAAKIAAFLTRRRPTVEAAPRAKTRSSDEAIGGSLSRRRGDDVGQ
jgi:hypothetical protein